MPTSDDRFLRLFDPDPVLAAKKYAALSDRLVWFFTRRGCSEPRDLAQDTFLRGLPKILTVDLHVEAAHYFYGIAKMLVFEDRKKERRRNRFVPLIENLTADPDDPEADELEGRPEEGAHELPSPSGEDPLPVNIDDAEKLLEDALRRLPRREAKLLIKYVNADATGRRALADQLGIDSGALRTRVCRIQGKLRRLVRRP